jgi:hypothetical protein
MTFQAMTARVFGASALGLIMLSGGPAMAQDAAIATKPAPAAAPAATPVPDEDGPIATKGKRIAGQILPVPLIEEAPANDFERVAWCYGILSGHMDIAERIGDNDPEIRAIGKSYLKTYEAALTLSTEGQTTEGHKRASEWQKTGFQSWATVRAATKDKQGGAYMNWMLPADCEKASVRISGRPNLFAEMQDEKEAALIGATLKRGPQSASKPKAKKKP